jgi:hypothetical protein
VSPFIAFISRWFEVISTFCNGEEIADFAEGVGDGVEAAGRPLSQQRLEL